MYHISQIFIYPIKSLGAIELNESRVEARGLQYDRRWMLCDAENNFITQRQIKALTLFKLNMNDVGFSINFNAHSFQIPFEIIGNTEPVKVWDDTCEAIEYKDASEWFSKVLSISCKLFYMPNATERLVSNTAGETKKINSFSDGYPILLIGKQSLHFLNSKLNVELDINRFRPNIVFDGGLAYDEDNFSMFGINDILFKGIKPCARCQVIGIDQSTAMVSVEPLKTLATYRTKDNKVLFGQNAIVLDNNGIIAVGNALKLY